MLNTEYEISNSSVLKRFPFLRRYWWENWLGEKIAKETMIDDGKWKMEKSQRGAGKIVYMMRDVRDDYIRKAS